MTKTNLKNNINTDKQYVVVGVIVVHSRPSDPHSHSDASRSHTHRRLASTGDERVERRRVQQHRRRAARRRQRVVGSSVGLRHVAVRRSSVERLAAVVARVGGGLGRRSVARHCFAAEPRPDRSDAVHCRAALCVARAAAALQTAHQRRRAAPPRSSRRSSLPTYAHTPFYSMPSIHTLNITLFSVYNYIAVTVPQAPVKAEPTNAAVAQPPTTSSDDMKTPSIEAIINGKTFR